MEQINTLKQTNTCPICFPVDRFKAIPLVYFFFVRAPVVSYVRRSFCHCLFAFSSSSILREGCAAWFLAFP